MLIVDVIHGVFSFKLVYNRFLLCVQFQTHSITDAKKVYCLFFSDFGSTIMLCFELKVSWYKNVVWVFLTKNHRKQHHINMENQFIYAVSKIDNGSSIDLIEKHQKSIDWFIKMWWTCVKRFLDLRTDNSHQRCSWRMRKQIMPFRSKRSIYFDFGDDFDSNFGNHQLTTLKLKGKRILFLQWFNSWWYNAYLQTGFNMPKTFLKIYFVINWIQFKCIVSIVSECLRFQAEPVWIWRFDFRFRISSQFSINYYQMVRWLFVSRKSVAKFN